MATRLKASEAKRRRARLVDAWNTGAIPATFGAASRHIRVHHSVVGRWVHGNVDGVGDAFRRAEGGFHLNGPPPIPGFVEFREQCFGHSTPPFQREWFQTIEDNDLSLVLVPPMHGKTSAVSIEYPVWRICRDRNVRIMIVSKTQAFARKNLYAIKKRLADASWFEANGYRNLVTEWGPFKPGQDDRSTPWSADLIYVSGVESAEKDPTCEALGIGNQIYGARADLIILDDVATIQNQESETERAKQLDWLVQEAMTRLTPEGKLVIIGTRVREYDIYSTLLDKDVEWAEDFASVVQPAITSEDGKIALWPEERPYDFLVRRYRNRMPARLWNLVFQQAASGGADNPFSSEALENAKDTSYSVGELKPGLPVVVGCDPAKEGPMAIVVVQYDKQTDERYIIDCIVKDKLRQREAMKAFILGTVRQYGATRCVIEKNFQDLAEDYDLRAGLHAANCSWESWKTTADSKYDPQWGTSSVAGQFEMGKWHIPWGRGSQPKMQALIDELSIWRPVSRIRQDRVMALWFASLGLRYSRVLKLGMPRVNPNMPAWVRNQKVPGWVRQARPQHRRVFT